MALIVATGFLLVSGLLTPMPGRHKETAVFLAVAYRCSMLRRAVSGFSRYPAENDRPVSPYPPLSLSRLRGIGWRHWDPIGILAAGETWIEHPAADEYDEYLTAVAGGLRRGWTRSRAIEELLLITEDMGLSLGAMATARAEATVDAIQTYLDEEKRISKS